MIWYTHKTCESEQFRVGFGLFMIFFGKKKNREYHQIYCSDKTFLICKTNRILNDKMSDWIITQLYCF